MWNENEALEGELRELWERNEMDRVIHRALQGYGAKLQHLTKCVLHDHDMAMDAYSLFCENLVKGLPGFRWQCSFLAWASRLARNACYQVRHTPAALREQALGDASLSDVPHPARTTTHPWQRSSVKGRFRGLREHLTSQEQQMLRLRVDQGLSWPEVARAMASEGPPLTGEHLHRKAAALRQQFIGIKASLRRMAREEGLIDSEEPRSPA